MHRIFAGTARERDGLSEIENHPTLMKAIVVIGASAGGLHPLKRILFALPIPCPLTIMVVMHIGALQSHLASILDRPGLPAKFAEDGEMLREGRIYVAPPDHHMTLGTTTISLNRGAKIHFTRPAADPLFISAAEAYGNKVVGIVLSGGGSDGALGLRSIEAHGGTAFVQSPESAGISSMPLAAMELDDPQVCTPDDIIRRLKIICS